MRKTEYWREVRNLAKKNMPLWAARLLEYDDVEDLRDQVYELVAEHEWTRSREGCLKVLQHSSGMTSTQMRERFVKGAGKNYLCSFARSAFKWDILDELERLLDHEGLFDLNV